MPTTKKPPALSAQDRKFEAEARAAEALAELHAANARRAEAETKQLLADARGTLAAAKSQELDLADEQRLAAEKAASDERNHVYYFGGAVDKNSTKACMEKLTAWCRQSPGCALTIVFNSPGGSVIDGFALWDHLAELRRAGHKLTTKVRGMAASMGGILLQAGDVRMCGAESVILVHEISFGAGGKIGEVEDEVEFAKMLTRRVLKIFAARTNMTERQIDARWRRKDWWLNSEDALKLGFVDEIG